MMGRGAKSEGIFSTRSLMIPRAMRKKNKKKTVVVGLKSHNAGREMLLRLVSNLVASGDTVLAVHVQEPGDTLFDPNSFHIYEDLCKSKQVDFHVKVCAGGSSSVAGLLAHQVRVNFATTLVLGWNGPWCKESLVVSCLKGVPPTCTLVVIDRAGRILLEQAGTSQQGSATTQTIQSPVPSSLPCTIVNSSETNHHPSKPSTPSSPRLRSTEIKLPSPSASPQLRYADMKLHTASKTMQLPETEGVPPTCTLMVMDRAGRILLEKGGTSQQGSATTQTIQSPVPSYLSCSIINSSETNDHPSKPSTPSSPQLRSTEIKLPSPSALPQLRYADMKLHTASKTMQLPETEGHLRQLQWLGLLEAKGATKRFTPQELARGTDDFSPLMMIGEGGNSKVYRAHLSDDRTVAVKLLKISERTGEDLLREAGILTKLNHKHIIRLIGYCYSDDMYAVVYSLMKGSLKQNLAHLGWGERVKIAVGVAKALNYLHHACSPPVIHRDVKSSNILLSYNCQPQAISHFSQYLG